MTRYHVSNEPGTDNYVVATDEYDRIRAITPRTEAFVGKPLVDFLNWVAEQSKKKVARFMEI